MNESARNILHIVKPKMVLKSQFVHRKCWNYVVHHNMPQWTWIKIDKYPLKGHALDQELFKKIHRYSQVSEIKLEMEAKRNK